MKYLLSILILFSGLSFSQTIDELLNNQVIEEDCMKLVNQEMRTKCITKSVGIEITKTDRQIWEEEISGYRFGNTSNYLMLYADGSLNGRLSTTQKDKGGDFFWNDGLWEIDYAYKQKWVTIKIYSEDMNCKYQITKKSKKYFFKKIEANFSNICPDTLMNRKLIN